jgi:hypothetical protein
MGQWWIFDLIKATAPDRMVTLRSMNAIQNAKHSPVDDLSLEITEITMMDDTIFFSFDPKTLCKMSDYHEVFQYMYGAKTAFGQGKTEGYVVQSDTKEPFSGQFRVRTVREGRLLDGRWVCTWQDTLVPVTSNPVFLKTTVDDQRAMFTELKSYIESFNVPKAGKHLPLAAVRRILTQLLMPRILQRLRLQPISPEQASTLDNEIATLINKYYGWQCRVKADVLQLSIDDHGFDIPSVSDSNAAISVSSLHRDLNHPCEPIRRAAHITLQDWTCQWNLCGSPLLMTYDRLNKQQGYAYGRSFAWRSKLHPCNPSATRRSGLIPSAWLTAALYMRNMHLSFLETDQSYISRGEISISHARGKAALPPFPPKLSSHRELTSTFICSAIGHERTDDFLSKEIYVTRTKTVAPKVPRSAQVSQAPGIQPFHAKVQHFAKLRFSHWARAEIRAMKGIPDPSQRQDTTALQFFSQNGLKVVGSVGNRALLYRVTVQGEGHVYSLLDPNDDSSTNVTQKVLTAQQLLSLSLLSDSPRDLHTTPQPAPPETLSFHQSPPVQGPLAVVKLSSAVEGDEVLVYPPSERRKTLEDIIENVKCCALPSLGFGFEGSGEQVQGSRFKGREFLS